MRSPRGPRLLPAQLLAVILVSVAASAHRSESPVATDKIFGALNVREGATVCEIGAGDGALSIAAAHLVGPTGRIYTSELGDTRVKALQANVAASGLTQVTVVSGDPNKTNFPDSPCDALFLRNVYHHFADPTPMASERSWSLSPSRNPEYSRQPPPR